MTLQVQCDTCHERAQAVPVDEATRAQFLWDIGWAVDLTVRDSEGPPTHKCPFCAGPEHEKKLRKIFDRGAADPEGEDDGA